MQDIEGYGRTWQHMLRYDRYGSIWKDIAGYGRIWTHMVRYGRIWEDLEHRGEYWSMLWDMG